MLVERGKRENWHHRQAAWIQTENEVPRSNSECSDSRIKQASIAEDRAGSTINDGSKREVVVLLLIGSSAALLPHTWQSIRRHVVSVGLLLCYLNLSLTLKALIG